MHTCAICRPSLCCIQSRLAEFQGALIIREHSNNMSKQHPSNLNRKYRENLTSHIGIGVEWSAPATTDDNESASFSMSNDTGYCEETDIVMAIVTPCFVKLPKMKIVH